MNLRSFMNSSRFGFSFVMIYKTVVTIATVILNKLNNR